MICDFLSITSRKLSKKVLHPCCDVLVLHSILDMKGCCTRLLKKKLLLHRKKCLKALEANTIADYDGVLLSSKLPFEIHEHTLCRAARNKLQQLAQQYSATTQPSLATTQPVVDTAQTPPPTIQSFPGKAQQSHMMAQEIKATTFQADGESHKEQVAAETVKDHADSAPEHEAALGMRINQQFV